MAPSHLTQFVDAALFNSGPQALSYTHNLKFIIREHLFDLLQEFPSLTPSTDTFTHDDGTSVLLLNAKGSLYISHNAPPIPLTIWLHQCYPYAPPLVFISLTPTTPIRQHHPFVDASGAATSPYLHTWGHPRSNLCGLARNLVRIFAQHPPFFTLSCNKPSTSPFLASKREALDRLVGSLHCDVVSLQAQVEQDVEELTRQQMMLVERAKSISTIALDLESEQKRVKGMLVEMAGQIDLLQNWLRVNELNSRVAALDGELEVFEAADEESNQILESMAGDHAIEDLLYELDKAMEEGLVTFAAYMKHVRLLAREQFFHRATYVKL